MMTSDCKDSIDANEEAQRTSRNRRRKEPWTPEQRQRWVEEAQSAVEGSGGEKEGYVFHVVAPSGVVEPDDKCARATDALAQLVYKGGSGRYRALGLGFYTLLAEKMRLHPVIGPLYGRRVIPLVKGSNAHALLLPHLDLPFSDLDITIFVDPRCDPAHHHALLDTLHTLVVQTMSQHKRAIDNTFFLVDRQQQSQQQSQQQLHNQGHRQVVLSPEVAEQFKMDHVEAMRGAGLVSVFEEPRVRNRASRNSMVMVQSKAKEGAVAKIEVPHFDKCERIPLCRTPVFCSYNETISTFNLYRIKFNSMHRELVEDKQNNSTGSNANEDGEEEDEAGEDDSSVSDVDEKRERLHRVQADFIDVTIPSQGDAELREFWEHGRYVATLDRHTDVFVLTPDLDWCLRDLWKLLHVHECPESKRLKREGKHELLMRELHRIVPGLAGGLQY